MSRIDTSSLMQVEYWGGDGGRESGEWLRTFETAMIAVWGEDAQMIRAFQTRMKPGSEAGEWFGDLPRATTSSWALLKGEFERRWPKLVTMGLSAREKMERFRTHVLKEEGLGRHVALESGLQTTSHAMWARLHSSFGRATAETDAWLIEETRSNLPPTLLAIIDSKPTQTDWNAFMSQISSTIPDHLI